MTVNTFQQAAMDVCPHARLADRREAQSLWLMIVGVLASTAGESAVVGNMFVASCAFGALSAVAVTAGACLGRSAVRHARACVQKRHGADLG